MLAVPIFNLKGGTGRTTTTLNLAANFAPHLKTCLVDLDGQRTLTYGLDMDGATPTIIDHLKGDNVLDLLAVEGVDNRTLIPGDLRTFSFLPDRDLMGPLLDRLKGIDLVLFDCPPSLSPLTVQALMYCDRTLITTLCEPASLRGLVETISLIRGDDPSTPIDVLRTRYRGNLTLTKEADRLLIEASHSLSFNLLHAVIPENVAIAEAFSHGEPVSTYAPRSKGAVAYGTLAHELSSLWRLPDA